jgi:TonB family protein
MKTVGIAILSLFMNTTIWAKNNDHDGIDPTKKYRKWETSLVSNKSATDNASSEGLVFVAFNLNDRGTAENIEVVKGTNGELNARAIELVKSMPKEHLYAKGFFEGTRFILPIQFSVE